MQIQLLSNQVTTQTNKAGKPMQVLEVAYKNLTFQGKVESKKLFDFGVQADAFKTLVAASPTTVFEVDVVKNNAGYNDWVKVTKSSATSDVATTATSHSTRTPVANASTKGNWETPEERAKKQVYIIRQSSLNVAAEVLQLNKKVPTAEEVIELAKKFEAYVLDIPAASDNYATAVSKDIETMDEDIPF